MGAWRLHLGLLGGRKRGDRSGMPHLVRVRVRVGVRGLGWG